MSKKKQKEEKTYPIKMTGGHYPGKGVKVKITDISQEGEDVVFHVKKHLVKLDVGCGGRGTMYDNYIGIDIYPAPSEPRKPGSAYVQLDFVYTATLPWKWHSVDSIVCFHVIEHMKRQEGVTLLERIYKLLKPGAQAFVSCPDSRLFIQKYLERDFDFYTRTYPKNQKEMWPGRTLLDRLFFSMYDERSYGHRCPYDQETLTDAAMQAGVPSHLIEPLPKDHFWCRRPDHECGIIITKEG